MYKSAKFSLVRCPKYQNLIPEVTHYSIFQIGDFGACCKLHFYKLYLSYHFFGFKFQETIWAVMPKPSRNNHWAMMKMGLSHGYYLPLPNNSSEETQHDSSPVYVTLVLLQTIDHPLISMVMTY